MSLPPLQKTNFSSKEEYLNTLYCCKALLEDLDLGDSDAEVTWNQRLIEIKKVGYLANSFQEVLQLHQKVGELSKSIFDFDQQEARHKARERLDHLYLQLKREFKTLPKGGSSDQKGEKREEEV